MRVSKSTGQHAAESSDGGLKRETGGFSPDLPQHPIDAGKCTYGHDFPCGHGECEKTGAWSEEVRGTHSVSLAVGVDAVRWSPDDLDRCEHGRHSIDPCFDCPGGRSHGNPFLLSAHSGEGTIRLDSGPSEIRVRGRADGGLEVRIGTMVRGEPIWVVVRDKPREDSVVGDTMGEHDDRLPCSVCGHQVRPGLHSQAECIRNQQADRGDTEPCADPECVRGRHHEAEAHIDVYGKEYLMTEQEARGKLPCSSCGRRVRPGRHSEAECIANQQDDAAEESQDQEDGNRG